MPAPRWLPALLLGVGCAHKHDHAAFHDALEDRSGARADARREPDAAPTLPEGVSLANGIDRDEAVAIALRNNPSLRAALTRLDAADAELAGAKRPANPNLRLLFPIGPTQFTALIAWPIESFATMPARLKLARLGQDAAVATALSLSLDLIRDVRLAHADAILASELLELRTALVAERRGMLEIAEAQVRLGDRPEADVEAVRTELALAIDEQSRTQLELQLAESRLRTLLGWGLDPIELRFASDPVAELPAGTLARAQERAFELRPELDGAALDVRRARTQLRLEGVAVLRLSGVAQTQPRALQLGPQVDLPIFDQNQIGRGRGRADLAAARWRQRALRERIAGEVREALLDFERALASYDRYREEIVASRKRALEAAEQAHVLGEVDFTTVLLAQRDLDGVRLRMAELGAEARRAHAQLERALGGRLLGDEVTQ